MATFGEDQWGLVKQFDQMRNSQGGNPVSLASYAPPPGPEMSTATPDYSSAAVGTPPAAPAQAAGVVQTANGPKLVDFNGRQISAGLRPRAEALVGQGLRLTSGYRDPAHNARVGGVKNSWHTKDGEHGALDFVGTAKQMQAGAAWAKTNGAREVLIHNVGSGQHLHVAW